MKTNWNATFHEYLQSTTKCFGFPITTGVFQRRIKNYPEFATLAILESHISEFSTFNQS